MSSTPIRRFHVGTETGPLVLVALGGAALAKRDERFDIGTRQCDLKRAAVALADVARRAPLVITHGEAPQVGLLALESEACRDNRTYPLDVLGAEHHADVASLLEAALANELPDHRIVSLLTQVVVEPLDPAFHHPAMPIGPAYSEADARKLSTERGWSVAADGGVWRRVVASPTPRSVVELPVIEQLVDTGVVVIASGGGGIPVVVDVHGGRHTVEAVVDKDWAAAQLARQLGAETLMLVTDIPAVMRDWGSPGAEAIRATSPTELRQQEFAPESIGSKVDAACWFVSTTGATAVIGALDDTAALLDGEAGTRITRDE